jgi:hypothetical protein
MTATPAEPVADREWSVDEAWVVEGFDRFDAEGHGPAPAWDAPDLSDVEALDARGAVSEWDLPLLRSIDPRSLDVAARVDFLRRVEAVASLVAVLHAGAVVALAGSEPSGDSLADRHVAHEVALARRVGEGAAASGIATARALHSDFPAFLAALERGEVSEWHCRELVSGTRHVTDPAVLAALQERLLPKARVLTPGKFRGEVRKAVADLDAERAADRLRRAREGRYVTYRSLDDGLGYVGLVTDDPTARALYARVTADGRALQLHRGGATAARAGDDDALADSCRADAFAARMLGTVEDDGSLVYDPTAAQVTLTVVMDLDTLRGEADRLALLDGEPVPASIGREYAQVATRWRRAVTDPVTGHLLDHGREQYLPEKLRDHILARDHCRAPGCTTRAASRLEMDHATPYPQGGTSAANCGGLCRHHHQLKTAGHTDIEASKADGSATWTTHWGQRVRIEPRPFLHDPRDHPPDPPPTAPPPPPQGTPDPTVDDPPF